MIYLCTQSQGFSWFQFEDDHGSTQKDISESDLSFNHLKSLCTKEGRENQMLALINALFCHAKVGVGDMDYYGTKNSEQLGIQPWSIKPQENLN